MNILLCSLIEPATGNATTAQRIRGHLESAGHRVTHIQADREWTVSELQNLVEQKDIALAIGIHAYGAGKHLRHLTIPTVIVFGGTDLNELTNDPLKFPVMSEAVLRAHALVAFDDQFCRKAAEIWPKAADKIHKISQATVVHPSTFSLRKALEVKPADRMFLLPSGLRPVKDPLFCAQMFSRWHAEQPAVHFVIIGAARDAEYANQVEHTVANLPGVSVHPPVSQDDLHAAMRESDIVLNTSVSESSPNAVLEAMALGVPVLVRDIPGNRSIVEHRKTGLLFHDPSDCRVLAEEVLRDQSLRTLLVANASEAIRSQHNVDYECSAYLRVIDSLLLSS